MYKVLIIDDEKIIRIALKSMIDWEQQGFTVSDMLSDGEIALKLLQRYSPHLIIVDIMMPKMDGLTFIKQAKKSGFNGKIIILSNHQEFNYVIEAIHNGVFDYIIKTDIEPETLIQLLHRVKIDLDSAKINKIAISDIVMDNKEIALFKKVVENKEIPIDNCILSNQYLFLDIFLRSKIINNILENSISQNTLKNIAMEFIDHSIYSIIPMSTDCILIIVPKNISSNFITSLPVITEKIGKLVSLYMNTDCGFVCSSIFDTLDQFSQKLELLPSIEQLVFYYGFHSIIEEKLLYNYSNLSINIRPLQTKLKKELTEGNYQACKDILTQSIYTFQVGKMSAARVIKALSKLYEFVILDNSTWLEKVKTDLHVLVEKHQKICTLEEYLQNFGELIDLIAKNKLIVHNSTFRKEISIVDVFIKQNMDKKITLSMIAQNVNMSENYISRLFKSETGINVINYINLIKMEHAKEMLSDPNIPIKEIALSLGFDDSSYFNKIFNKLYNFNPSEYRKIVLR